MGYDPYEHRGDRDERSRWERERSHRGHDPRGRDARGQSGRDERGFFERAGEEISSWFGGADDDHRGPRGQDRQSSGYRQSRDREERGEWMSHGRDQDRERGRGGERHHEQGRHQQTHFASSERDYGGPQWRERAFGPSGHGEDRGGYRPMAGDYGRSGSARGGYGGGNYDPEELGPSKWDQDEYRRTSFAGSVASSNYDDRHYHECRQRHLDEFERDYDAYRRERNSRFESDFGGWRERRQSKRTMLRGIREDMEVVGSDGRPVGTVERIAGDRIILAPTGPDAGGPHRSLRCTDIDRVEGDRVILETSGEKGRWRDEGDGRALFEREDRDPDGPHVLGRSFSGTYR
jgi:hypothetical protein